MSAKGCAAWTWRRPTIPPSHGFGIGLRLRRGAETAAVGTGSEGGTHVRTGPFCMLCDLRTAFGTALNRMHGILMPLPIPQGYVAFSRPPASVPPRSASLVARHWSELRCGFAQP
jgi:hypothetical protein